MSATFNPPIRASRAADKSLEFLLSLEVAHTEVELGIASLEGILAEDRLADVGYYSAVRARLANANLNRARIAQQACDFLRSTGPDDRIDVVRELERCEIEHFQMISKHIRCWTPRAVQDHWRAYVEATRKVLGRVRKLILIEQMQLLPRLRSE